MPEVRRPRRGSLAYYPRKRAKRIYPRVSSYPEVKEVKLLGFAGYKAGMGHVVVLDNDKNSKTFGQKISVPVTVIDCPPLRVVGIRFYGEDDIIDKIKQEIEKKLAVLEKDKPKMETYEESLPENY